MPRMFAMTKISSAPEIRYAVYLWLAVLVIQYIVVRDYASLMAYAGSRYWLIMQGSGFSLFFITVLFAIIRKRVNPIMNFSADPVVQIWIIISLYILAQSSISIDQKNSIIYLFVLIAAIIVSRGFASLAPEEISYILGRGAFFILVSLTILLLVNGLNGRTLGWAPPNSLGKAAFVGIVCAAASNLRFKYLIMLLHFIFLILLTSRGMLLSSVIFIFIFLYASREVNTKSVILSTVSSTTLISIVSLFQVATGARITVESIGSSIMMLNDPDRGLGSGLTGRLEYWARGLDLITHRPLFGYGFRTRGATESFSITEQSAHSGFINLTIDLGIFGLFLFFILFTIIILRASIALRHLPTLTASHRLHATGLAFFGSLFVFWTLEPTYLNFGVIDIIPFLFLSSFVGVQAVRVARLRNAYIFINKFDRSMN